ncbi:MAG: bifunctional aspartate kinase/homoserine dehydrogenase I [Acidobacteriota bacterium]
MKILKFGGSSLATPERVLTVAGILDDALARGPIAVVLSAFGGVTDQLLAAAAAASDRDAGYRETLAGLAERHLAAVETLASEEERADLRGQVEVAFEDLADLLRGVWLLREASPRTLDSVSSYGERLSVHIVAAALRRVGIDAEACDARRLVMTDAAFGHAQVEQDETYANLRSHFEGASKVQVVTGFLGATRDGETTTLGRGGSDYTASLLGAALAAEAVELWTDVDGVMSADPRQVPSARPIPRLGYEDLMELSHFGAKVVYPPSVHPARAAGVPLAIKNTLRPAVPGTRVDLGSDRPGEPLSGGPVCGVTSIRPVALLRLEGAGMVGVPGIAMRLFGALAREAVSVILISQASSEHSICFAIEPSTIADAERAIGAEFALERQSGRIDDLVVEQDLAIVAVVGSGMREQPGIGSRLFGVLGEGRINVRAIAQGSSERNISLVVAAADETRALEAIHGAFFGEASSPPTGVPADAPPVELFVAGAGRVGGELFKQLSGRRDALAAEGIDLAIAAVANSSRMLARAEGRGLDPAAVVDSLAEGGEPSGVEGLVDFALGGSGPARIFVDVTASPSVAAFYDRLLEDGVSVVTANKLRLAGPLEGWRSLRRLTGRRSDQPAGRLYFETTVGAGLPVIRTLADLLATGDRLVAVEGVFSGTLSYLMSRLEEGVRLSEAVREAWQKGFTEPDPRQDLGGLDAARKLLILARLAGHELAPEEVEVEPLVPDGPPNEPLDDFWLRLAQHDDAFEERLAAVRASGRRLRYRASFRPGDDDGSPRVALEEVPEDHPLAGVTGSDNMAVFTTERYRQSPLVIRGRGAGPEVTAAGVFADILRAVAEANR